MKIKILVSYIAPLALLLTACSQSSVKEVFSTPMAAARSYLTAMKAGDTNLFQRATLGAVDWIGWLPTCSALTAALAGPTKGADAGGHARLVARSRSQRHARLPQPPGNDRPGPARRMV